MTDTGKKISDDAYSFSPVLKLTPGGRHELSVEIYSTDSGNNWSLDSTSITDGMTQPIKLHHSGQTDWDKYTTIRNHIEVNGESTFTLDGTLAEADNSTSITITTFIVNRMDGKIVANISGDAGKLGVDIKLMAGSHSSHLERRLQLDYKHKIESGAGSASLSFAWDADRDANKQASLEVVSSLPSKGLDLDSVLVICSERYVLKLKSVAGDGSRQFSATFQHPSGESMSFNLNTINVATETGMTNEFLFETTLPSGALYHLTLKNVLSNLNKEEMTFEAVTEVAIKSPHLQEITMAIESRRSLESRMAKVSIVAPKFTLPVDGYVEITKDGGSLHAIAAYKCGEMTINMEASTKLILRDTKITLGSSFDLEIPSLPFKQIKYDYFFEADLSGTSITVINIKKKHLCV